MTENIPDGVHRTAPPEHPAQKPEGGLGRLGLALVFWLGVGVLGISVSGYVALPPRSAETTQDPLVLAEFWRRQNCKVLIFPEGARSADVHRLLRFRRGAFDVAQRVGLPVVPVAIQGTGRVLGKGKFLFRFRGRIRTQALDPVWVSVDGREVASKVRSLIQHAIDQPA